MMLVCIAFPEISMSSSESSDMITMLASTAVSDLAISVSDRSSVTVIVLGVAKPWCEAAWRSSSGCVAK
jgi:hypothetical protein